MDSSDSDSDLERNRQSMFNAVSMKRKKGKEISEDDRCSEVQGYLDEGVAIDAKDEEGNTVLHVAVKRGLEKVVKFLLEKRAWTDIENSQRDTAITLAEKLGKPEIARMLKDSNGNRSEPLAGASKTQRFGNVGHDSGAVSSNASRKRTAGIEIAESVKKLKLAPANRTKRDSRPSSKEERSSGWDTKDAYAASGAKHSLHGVIYQLKHLMLTLNLAWKMGCRFRLATEMDSAMKFDDLVFEYEDSEGSRVHRFVQMKHKQDDAKLIKAGDLLAEDPGEFSVKKYFVSWRKIKKHADFAESESKYFILCTNIGLDVEELKNEQIHVIPVAESDDFLKVRDREAQPPRYKLLPGRQSELYAKLRSASDLHQLANAVAECVRNSNQMTLKTDIFKRYHTALAQEVLVSIDKKQRKFSDAFVRNNGLSPAAEDFRQIFFAYVKQFPTNKNLPDRDVWNDLGKRSLASSESFGKSTSGSQQTQSDELPDDHITDKDVSDFLDEFVLAVNQPNEVELGESIKREFGEYSQFNLLNTNFVGDSFQNILLNWFKDKQGVYLVREDAEKFFDELERELGSLITIGLNLPYPAKLKKYDVRFKREIEGLRSFLNSSQSTENLIWQLTSFEQTLLTALRIHQTLDQTKEYKKNDSFVFIELENLLLPVITKQVFRAFQSSSTQRLLIIDCGLDSIGQDTDQLWKSICEIMTKLREERVTGKRMILIVPRKDAGVIKLELAYKTSHEADGDIGVDGLREAAQRKLLGKKLIKFQGREKKISLSRLLGRDNLENVVGDELDAYKRIINHKTLVKLIRDEEIRIGSETKGLGEIAEYYIPRTIHRRVIVEERILGDPEIPDTFAIAGTVGETLEKLLDKNRTEDCSSRRERSHLAKYIILEKGRETDHFDRLCKKNPDLDIHWLQRESEKFIWKRSSGNIINLIKYRTETGSDDFERQGVIPLTEEQLAGNDEQRQVVILSDTAGMGKSTVLNRLAEKIRENEASLLVLKIDLTDHTTALASEEKARSFKSNDINAAVDFLVDKLNPDLEREAASVYKTIIKVQREAALLFDGFDEISPDYKETVIDLLEAIAKLGVKKLFVTTRPHTSRALEEKLGVFSHTLQSFSAPNQIEFLIKFWNRGSIAQDSISRSFQNKEALQEHAQNVINLLTESIDPSMKEFTGVPLQTRMVAEVFPFEESEVPKAITIVEMYSKFVDKKFHIFSTEKRRANHTNLAVKMSSKYESQIFSTMHQKFALNLLFDYTTAAMLLSAQATGDDFDACRDIINERQRTGIITAEGDGGIRFIHRTFAEYFAAIFLVKLLQNDRGDRAVGGFFVAQLFVKREYQVIRAFLNCLLAGKTLEKNSWKFDLSEHRNTEGGTAYHVAAREGHAEIAKFLLNCLREDTEGQFANINCRSTKGDGITPLIVAVSKVDNFDVVKCFIDAGADVNLPDSFLKQTPLHVSLRKTVSFDVVNYLLARGADIHSQTEEHNTPLYYAAKSGNLDLVKHLIKNGADVRSLNFKSETILHAAAESGNLDLAKHLIEKYPEIHSETKDGDTPLHHAARYGHLDLMKHMMEKGADIHSKTKDGNTPLHHAARYGHLDLVKHLMEKGADLRPRNKDGQTPPHLAARSGHLDLVTHLIVTGMDNDFKNENGETLLHSAAESGNLDLMKYLVEKGADVHSRTTNGNTPLHNAARSGHLDLAKYLTRRGADLHSQTENGETLLHLAAMNNRGHVVKYFVKKGADVNARTENGETPLHSAINYSRIEVIERLIKKGADVRAQNENGETPVHLAASGHRSDVVLYFIEKGADVFSQTKNGETLLHAAADSGDRSLVEYLIEKGVDIHSQTTDRNTVLHHAARSGHLKLVKHLMGIKMDIHSRTENGETPLHLAALCGQIYVVKHLSKKGADINSQTVNGETPLHLAALHGRLDVVKHFVKKGADVNCQTKIGETPLHSAALCGQIDVAKYLIKKGADVQSRTEDGETPLHLAALHGQLDVVKNFVKKGADVQSRTTNGETPQHYAAYSGNLDLVKHLTMMGADLRSKTENGETLLHPAAASGNVDLVKHLTDKGADLNSQTEIGETPLHYAASCGNPGMLKHLIGAGVDLRSQTENGNTPLHYAALRGQIVVVKHFINEGADIHSQTENGETPLHLAALRGQTVVVKHLIRKGAGIRSETRNGDTPLHYAAYSGNLHLVKHLLEIGADLRSLTKDGHTPLHYAAESGNPDLVKHLIANGAANE